MDDVREAAARLDAGEPHPFGSPTTYVAVVDGKEYPAKALIGLAARRAAGRDLGPDDFLSGLGANQSVPVLKKLGVEIRTIGSSKTQAAPAAWIFQGNPDRFDIDGYLAAHRDITWLVKQHHDEIVEGQTVYLWRAGGRGKAIAGVVAVGSIAGSIEQQRDDGVGLEFWHSAAEATTADFRVPIRVHDVASPKRVIKAKWLQEDPVCQDLPNFRNRQQTNYPLESPHAERLARLWSKTGLDFDRFDLLLTLRAYAQTFGGPVSVRPGSLVAETAVLAGRAVSSIYSKVMNFRSLDPRVEGVGQPNGGIPTKEVWDEFWTGTEIDEPKLSLAINGLLEPGSTPESHAGLESESNEAAPHYSAEGRRRLVTHLKIERNGKVVADAKARWFVADPMLRCCVCHMSFGEVYGSHGDRFIEAHHTVAISTLDEPKPPDVDDLAPVCSNCHRMLHREGSISIEALRALVRSSRLGPCTRSLN